MKKQRQRQKRKDHATRARRDQGLLTVDENSRIQSIPPIDMGDGFSFDLGAGKMIPARQYTAWLATGTLLGRQRTGKAQLVAKLLEGLSPEERASLLMDTPEDWTKVNHAGSSEGSSRQEEDPDSSPKQGGGEHADPEHHGRGVDRCDDQDDGGQAK